jgi:exonuclease III
MLIVYKKATMNNDGLASRTRMEFLKEFLRKQEVDILFLQEDTHHNFDTIRG